MRIAVLVLVIAVALYGCADAPPPPAANIDPAGTPTAPLRSDIPRLNGVASTAPPGADAIALGDLDAIVERGYLRVLVARSGTHFFPHEGGHAGRTVDAGVALTQWLRASRGRTVQPVFIETHEPDLIPHLLAGKGDIAANLLLTFARDDQVAFAPPIRTGIRELVVTPENAPLRSLEDVGERTIHVRDGSDHHASLLRLNEQLRKAGRPAARIVLAQPPITDEQLLDRVHQGHIPATIVDDYVFERQRAAHPNMVANPDIAVSQDGSLSWVTRKDAPQLIALLKEFFAAHRLTF